MLKSTQEYEEAIREMQEFLNKKKAPRVRSQEAQRFDYLIDAIEEYEQNLELEDVHVD